MLNGEQKLQLIELIDRAEDLKKNGDFISAIDCYEKILCIDPDISSVYSIIANLYAKAYGDSSLDKQIYYYKKILDFRPNNTLALHGLAFCNEKLGNNSEAEKYYKLLLALEPSDIDFYNYGMFLIHNGDFINGHKYFTRRFNINDINLHYPVDVEGDKRWDFRTDLSDKTLLVHYEQGFGDTIMYCRFLPALAQMAHRVIFAVQNELFTLINGTFEGIEVVTEGTIPDYDYSMALLDAPYALGTTIYTIPFTQGYLGKNLDVGHGKNLRIGIAYAGNKEANYHGRDLSLRWFAPLVEQFATAEFYSLQKNETEIVQGIIPLGQSFKYFEDTAEAIKSMDLIITTDNVILNLAGALGVKTIGLFNKQTNFRWYKTQGADVGWYNSVRPLQCKTQDDWNEVFEQVPKIIKTELTLSR